MLAYVLPQVHRDDPTGDAADDSDGEFAESGVHKVANTLTGMGPSTPTDADLGPVGQRTQGASSIDGTTSQPDIAVSARPGASPLTVELRLLDAYLRQVKRCEVPLTLAVGKTKRRGDGG